MMTITEMIAAKGIKMTVRNGAPINENFVLSNGYTCTLHYNGKQLTTPFYMGVALIGSPTVDQVLDSLLSAATSYDDARSFETFCNEFGYDTDDSTAKKVYRACARMSKKLHAFLSDEFDTFAFETERL